MVLFMPQSVYGLTAGDKFLVAATATLVGSALRLPYTMATARFGGRNWTVFTAGVLVLPVVATIVVLAEPGRPLWVYLACAALCGLGGGNFASSMTNINAFFPQRLKGWALGDQRGRRQYRCSRRAAGRAVRDRDRGQPATVLGVRILPGGVDRRRDRGHPVHGQPRRRVRRASVNSVTPVSTRPITAQEVAVRL
jgi:hypothetical protein